VVGPNGQGFLTGMKAIAAGYGQSLALKQDGAVWAWGDNSVGELGIGTSDNNPHPVPVQVVSPNGQGFLTGVVAVAAGGYSSLALKSDGTVWAWGDNQYGHLGIGTGDHNAHPLPVQVVSPNGQGFLTGVVAIASANDHSLALKGDGTVWAWGSNFRGQLGNGAIDDNSHPAPVQVLGPNGSGSLTGVVAVAAGGVHSLALKGDGTVWAWGESFHGQLGDGTFHSDPHPLPVHAVGPNGHGFLTGVVAIAAGYQFSLGLKSDGTLWAWGYNGDGELGIGTSSGFGDFRATPQQVSGLMGVKAVSAGVYHSLALVKRVVSDFDGDGKADLLWHNQQNGQLVYWLMDGTKLKTGGMGNLTPSEVSPVWKIVGTPDLDGDGKPDLLWHNQSTGQLVYWLLDGVKVKPGGMGHLTPSVMSPLWALAPGS
jgi:alpha-tubulin suppressor-like RCC1 family protein